MKRVEEVGGKPVTIPESIEILILRRKILKCHIKNNS